MPVNSAVRRRLEAQGFCDLDEATLDEVGPWLRWSPAFCTLFMVVGVALNSSAVLWALAVTALLGALLPFHPFDLLYNYGARYLTGTRPLPHQGPQRRFACGIATVWLLVTGWAFYAGAPLVGYLLGAPLILVAALVSITHYCIPSLIYNTLFKARGSASS
ncbi:MAG: hypothetical protein A3E01_17835 [Gammaproteobacteria bacterium RIFCSPHIGHO2_12_FULL_63_22]|nr:MAG: hypothetical protein A3E01_17835 [Gammaproteobacteria bacterium RIFCSPHIGHO2_12_FULL_63_22]